jgi:GT2 family glycosyltransferase
MNKPSKRVQSVCAAICCYNARNYIKNAVESLLIQTHSPDEIIIVDDGSTDGSMDLLKDYPVKIIKHDFNKGLSLARNTALNNAKSDILLYIDSDTVAEINLIDNVLKCYDKEDVSAAGGQGIEVNINNIFDKWRKFNAQQTLGDKKIDDAMMLPGLCCSFRISTLKKIGSFDEFFKRNAEDHDICIRLKKTGGRLVYSPDIIVKHYRRDNFKSLLSMIYRYDLWTIIAKKRNGIDSDKSSRIYIFRIKVFLGRIKQILKERKGVKFALIDFLMIFVSICAVIKSKFVKFQITDKKNS